MSEETLKTYRGNCHCGAFVYEAKLPEIKSYSECNCSLCHKIGYAWLFPDQGNLDIVKGSVDDLKAYTFNKGDYIYRFCSDCGTAVLAEMPNKPPGMKIGINARAIQNLDCWSLEAKPFDGKSTPPSYNPPVYKGPEPSAEIENGKTYHGSCHCGAVTVAVKLEKPLEEWDISVHKERILECNCSICARGGYVWIYPPKENSVIEGREHLSYRIFRSRILRKPFCKHCGVHICNESNPLTDEEIEGLSDVAKGFRDRIKHLRPINLRMLNDFDCKGLKTEHADGWNEFKPHYVNP
ncbi:Centromere protein V [Cytospora mali]|uniref:Centromere protein V n=1 Tax=Cytospora mali TaxID=578113 RepID=A0A194UT73_CYTMA|nr:Centromere protein V [Valsa mali var. pyri (nom. inval.)]